MREAVGLESELPQSWYHLATLYLREHEAERSRLLAAPAFDAFSKEWNTTPEDKIGALLVLSGSLCQLHRYSEAISYLRSGLAIERILRCRTAANRTQLISAGLCVLEEWRRGSGK
jgi:hypothetical protein